jgi:hypothetical protein
MWNCETLDIVMHKNVRLSHAIVSDIQDSDHLQIFSHLHNHVRTMNFSNTVDKFADLK